MVPRLICLRNLLSVWGAVTSAMLHPVNECQDGLDWLGCNAAPPHFRNPPDPAKSWRLPHRSNWQAARDIRTGERSISVPSRRTPPESKCSGGGSEKGYEFRRLRTLHQNGTVMRSRESCAGENQFDHAAPCPVLSPSRITLENNGKIRPQPDRENSFIWASGG